MRRELLALAGLGLLLAAPRLLALETDPAARPAQAAQAAAPQTPPATPPAAEEQEVRRAEEVTVESASKVESKLIDAPATMSVVTSEHARARSRPRTWPTCCARCRA